MTEDNMWKPSLAGGVLLGTLSALPLVSAFNCFCCAWVLIGGILAAHLYVKASPSAVTLGRGAILGLRTGIIGTVVYALFSIPLHFLSRDTTAAYMEQLHKKLAQLPNVPAETREMLDAMMARGDVHTLMLVFGLIFTFVLYCLFGMLGSSIGVALFEKRKAGGPPNAAISYEPPPSIPPPPEAR